MIQNYLEKHKILFGSTILLEKKFHKPTLVSGKEQFHDVLKVERELILSCDLCKVKNQSRKFIYGHGNINPELFIVIDSPSKFDFFKGKLISGDQEVILKKALNAINLVKEKNTYITSFLKYMPKNGRHILVSEFENCISHFNKLIKIINPKVIILVGKSIGNLMLNKETNIDDLRGNIFRYLNIPTIVTYHPNSIIESRSLKNLFWKDIKLVRSILKNHNEKYRS